MPDQTDWFDPHTTTFGDRLTGAREAVGMSVDELAQRLGVKRKTILAWEDDRSEPRANRVSTLAGLTSVSLMWLMTGAGDGPTVARHDYDGDLGAELGRLRRDAAALTDRLARLEARLRAPTANDA
ncbi:helix-turn-helix domain-containing protein [Jannaschia rubra]|uniref:helix-turn-helix domain-containing protein n=1 Tax=Jannaschia rubra TaxID=282197 RepID=UPI002492654C|nr:helix-turn-helix transcriptional regulator [Jannaschia rubra]